MKKGTIRESLIHSCCKLKKNKNKKHGASAFYGYYFEETGETDRKKA